MKIKGRCVLYFFFTSILVSCQSNKKESNDDNFLSTKETLSGLAYDSTAVKQESPGRLNTNHNLDKTNHTFIRSAEIKFKTKNVKNSTEKIEDITARYKGFIINSTLQTTVHSVSETPVSIDSTIILKSFFVENNIIIKIPNQNLDSMLRELNGLVSFLDYSMIKAEDVSLQMLDNNLQRNRLFSYEKRMTQAIDSKGKKLLETNISEESLLNRQNQSDQIKISNLSLEDQVAYSTINIHIYQNESRFKELTANLTNYEIARPYKVNIFSRLGNALIDGWYYFEEIILFFAKIWFVLLGGCLIFIFYRRFREQKFK